MKTKARLSCRQLVFVYPRARDEWISGDRGSRSGGKSRVLPQFRVEFRITKNFSYFSVLQSTRTRGDAGITPPHGNSRSPEPRREMINGSQEIHA